jgi:aminoglycoside 3'-phosphotransferase-2
MSNSFDTTLPTRLSWLTGRASAEITLGKSGAAVWRIDDGPQPMFLKTEQLHPLSEMPGEAARLEWLAGTSLPAPKLLDHFEQDGTYWLLMTALPGHDLTHAVDRPQEVVETLATALRQIHAIDPSTCPFDHRLDARLANGAANVAAGIVDETDFDTAHEGWTAGAVLDWLRANRPPTGNHVVTHGDVSLPNLMAANGAFSGFIDCGRLGVADPWQDLAIACRSLTYNCGPEHVAPFLDAYGAEWDEERNRFYNALDELF